jgi:MGT family glycosyltransferase
VSRFLICVWPLKSHVYPFVPVAQALRDRGHEVRFYSGLDGDEIVSAEGFHCFPFRAVDDDWVRRSFLQDRAPVSLRDARRFRRFMTEWLVDTVPDQVSDLNEITQRWRPDVLVSETSMWAPMLILSEQHDTPVVVFSTVIACLLPGPGIPPYGLGLRPPRRWHGRAIAWLLERTRERLAAKMNRTANAVRSRYGIAPMQVATVTEHTGKMPLYLVPTVREFDYDRRTLPPSVHYIGPCIWNRPRREARPDWLDELPEGQPVVHITEGTMNTQRPVLLEAGAKGLADTGMQVIMTHGHHRDPETLGLGKLPSNVRLERYVAHEHLLPVTDLVVTIGGAGTISAALSAGIPLIVVPMAWDQPENARRVEAAGAGLYLPPRRCTPAGLRQAVQRILDDSSFKRNARRLAKAFNSCDGSQHAADLLEGLISQCRTDATTAEQA